MKLHDKEKNQMMTQVEHDKWLLGLLKKHFTPYEMSEEVMNEAAKMIADDMDNKILEILIQQATNENN